MDVRVAGSMDGLVPVPTGPPEAGSRRRNNTADVSVKAPA